MHHASVLQRLNVARSRSLFLGDGCSTHHGFSACKLVPDVEVYALVYDLRHHRERADSQSRLDTVLDISYIGLPYFDQAEAEILKGTLVPGDGHALQTLEEFIKSTLDERLNRRMKKRVESADYRVCAAHDLAPIWEQAFAIKPKDLAKNKEFAALLDKKGLAGAIDWKGSAKHENAKPQKKTKKSNKRQ